MGDASVQESAPPGVGGGRTLVSARVWTVLSPPPLNSVSVSAAACVTSKAKELVVCSLLTHYKTFINAHTGRLDSQGLVAQAVTQNFH